MKLIFHRFIQVNWNFATQLQIAKELRVTNIEAKITLASEKWVAKLRISVFE